MRVGGAAKWRWNSSRAAREELQADFTFCTSQAKRTVSPLKLKSEFRSPKPERSPNSEVRRRKLRTCCGLRPSGFGFLSDFGLRISDFTAHVNASNLAASAKSFSLGPPWSCRVSARVTVSARI